MSKFQTSIHEYLETLPLQTFNRLYQKPATCLAIFRLLPPLGKQIIMSSLYVDTPIPVTDMKLWFKESAGLMKQKEAMQRLKALHIFSEERGNYAMNATFLEQFRNALTGGGNSQSFGLATSTPDKHHVDIAFLDDYATKQWEAILHFMVGTTEGRPPCKGVLNLLGRSGLMTGGSDVSSHADSMDARDFASQMARQDFGVPKITHKGFQFLLQDINTQVWAFLLQYLNMAESLNMDLVEVLTFFFQLGSLELGNDYSSETLTPTQTHLLEDLKAYGIVYQRKRGSRRFYPTRLATTLTSGTPVMLGSHTNATKLAAAAAVRKGEEEEGDDHGFIILETNYRLYAYTDSPLQIAVLNLFVHLRDRFPNMVTGVITRDSIRRALTKGITAEQIITYLTAHAHAQMRKHTPVLPLTVVDQIRLWEIEKNRLRPVQSWLYSDFGRQQDFESTLEYASELGVVLWSNQKRRLICITTEGHQAVGSYVRKLIIRQKEQAQQAQQARQQHQQQHVPSIAS
ncbi:RNA polymerase II transcription factor B 52 kDa subunit [Lobosporangium transversale]|uniref:RNA polymerase II transcription factor B subunit 2 n=1 Tax=Lobosporangium transversale TaxID=64571 RepID=A0A1Y2GRI9_9FUNG|nr:RNA polymerase II transcription factor B subunit 2 [Lobosporangium transversale]KAF9911327.1 RNA polymerase II transcription factor B 52 kDa subunit [Lobosporangium transversale]ORZ20144.1 RNA polymerase II transcription factor B subunit 2 [Lobosporangium transversale]|eukprot:XP_021882684.1 RNA polymerase II transcription factor B subunit 2 [Lobosporangium transversale]